MQEVLLEVPLDSQPRESKSLAQCLVDAATYFTQISILIITLSLIVPSATYLKSRLQSPRSQALVLIFVLTCLPLAKAAQKWALSDDATVLPDADIYANLTPNPQIVIAQAFKSNY